MKTSQLVKQLSGNSGCNIYLYKKPSGVFFVRKISSNESYNSRLEAQFKKQQSFTNQYIKSPKIYGFGYINNLFYFDMEFIRGTSLSKYIETINVSELTKLGSLLFNNNLFVSKSYKKIDDINICFLNKIRSISSNMVISSNSFLMQVIDYLLNYDWSRFNETWCHGDFTTENIIIGADGNVYLIDFLDSFYDSWILDFATILQDLECMWAYRKRDNIDTNTKIRLVIFRDIVLDKLSRKNKCLIKDVYCALILKLLRIYPYSSDERDIMFLERNILTLFNKVKQL